uniref:Uncharacterized protein n=1 Tax=Hyaloperonospora arabidopsidis (strain Emoy2) TaxID=559515 RepID=M4BMC1_HYAAE
MGMALLSAFQAPLRQEGDEHPHEHTEPDLCGRHNGGDRVDAERGRAAPHGKRVNTAPHAEQGRAAPHGKRVNTAPHAEQGRAAPHGKRVNTAPHAEQGRAVGLSAAGVFKQAGSFERHECG